jgi:hypothetical protein
MQHARRQMHRPIQFWLEYLEDVDRLGEFGLTGRAMYRWTLRTQDMVLDSSCYGQGSGRAIAEAVSRWLPNAAARVRARVWQVEFVVDKVASGQVSS